MQIIATYHQGILIEGQVYAGEVRLYDGRFQTFRWQAQRGRSVHCQVAFEEGEYVTFNIEADCLALRFQYVSTGESAHTLSTLDPSVVTTVFYNPYRRNWLLRFSLASEPSVFAPSLSELYPYSRDHLLVEVCTDGRSDLWQPLAHASIQLKPLFETCEVVNNKVLLMIRGPRETRIHITERSTTNPSSPLRRTLEPQLGIPMQVALTYPAPFQSILVDVTLVANDHHETRTIVAPPRFSLEEALLSGLGWGEYPSSAT